MNKTKGMDVVWMHMLNLINTYFALGNIDLFFFSLDISFANV